MATYRSAYLRIEPLGDLGNTARVLGEALGGLSFDVDASGFYEEFPAFVCKHEGMKYALLGIPSPDDYLGDEPLTDFELQVTPIDSRGLEGREDFSSELAERIAGHGKLRFQLPLKRTA